MAQREEVTRMLWDAAKMLNLRTQAGVSVVLRDLGCCLGSRSVEATATCPSQEAPLKEDRRLKTEWTVKIGAKPDVDALVVAVLQDVPLHTESAIFRPPDPALKPGGLNGEPRSAAHVAATPRAAALLR